MRQERYFSDEYGEVTRFISKTDRVKKILEFIDTGKTVIDLGCNDGTISNLIRLRSNDVTGVDFPKVIEEAKKKYPNINYISFDLSKDFPIESGSFDMVVANFVIEHIIDDVKFLKECNRILKPGGDIIISTQNIAFIRDRIWLLLGKFISNTSDSYNHIHQYTFDAMKRKILEAGFKNIQLKGAVYDLGYGFFKDIFKHFKYCYQNPLWFIFEKILPRNFRAFIIAKATK